MENSKEWISKKSKSRGKMYYFNVKTGQSSWTKPGEPDPPANRECSKKNRKKKNNPAKNAGKHVQKEQNKPEAPNTKPGTRSAIEMQTKIKREIAKKVVPQTGLQSVNKMKHFKNNTTPPVQNNNNRSVKTPEVKIPNGPFPNSTVKNNQEKSILEKSSRTRTSSHQRDGAEMRMTSLRNSINAKTTFEKTSTLANDSLCNKDFAEQNADESMDWESIVDEVIQTRILNQQLDIHTKPMVKFDNNIITQESINVVIDTNIFLSHLETVEKLISMGTDVNRVIIIVPWRVFCELDAMKSGSGRSTSNNNINFLSRRALNFLHKNLQVSDRITGQTLKEASNHIFKCSTPDDEILNCCLQISESKKSVIILSNDKNLCNKAVVNNIEAYTHQQFESNFYKKYFSLNISRSSLTTKTIQAENMSNSLSPNKSVTENNNNEHVLFEEVEKTLKDFLSIVLETEMKRQFDNLWLEIVLVKPPWSLSNILKCLIKHWMAVFNEVLPKEAQKDIKDLQYFYPVRRKVKEISSFDLKCILTNGLNLVKYLENDKKYNDHAKLCCKSLNAIKNNSITDGKNNTPVSVSDGITKIIPVEEEASKQSAVVEDAVSNTLIFIWNGFTVFCSQLANQLGITHCLGNNFNAEVPLGELILQANSVHHQIKIITEIISRVLLSFPIDNLSPDYKKLEANQSSDTFYRILGDTVLGMGQAGLSFQREILIEYCNTNRNILEDGFNKFSMLQKLLDECSAKCSNLTLV